MRYRCYIYIYTHNYNTHIYAYIYMYIHKKNSSQCICLCIYIYICGLRIPASGYAYITLLEIFELSRSSKCKSGYVKTSYVQSRSIGSLGLQIAQSRSHIYIYVYTCIYIYIYTLSPKVGIIYVLGAPGAELG